MCGRKLTDPVSIAAGVGPTCAGRPTTGRKRHTMRFRRGSSRVSGSGIARRGGRRSGGGGSTGDFGRPPAALMVSRLGNEYTVTRRDSEGRVYQQPANAEDARRILFEKRDAGLVDFGRSQVVSNDNWTYCFTEVDLAAELFGLAERAIEYK
ncbi:MAG: DUF6011 domain-containing protein [Chloroflexi bacterium]|nr:DUF6011 domain-containing protein [Chloroflexota bacterium]